MKIIGMNAPDMELSVIQKVGIAIMLSGLILNNGLFIYSYYRMAAQLKESGIKQNGLNPFGVYFQFRELVTKTSQRSDRERKQQLEELLKFGHCSILWTILMMVVGAFLVLL